jgi:hypothetical protein
MSKFEICVSVGDLAKFFRVSEDYVRSQAQFEVIKVKGGLEVISKDTYPRLSKVLYSQAPSLCVYTLEKVVEQLKEVYDKKEFIDKFLESEPSAIVRDLFTNTPYYWSDSLTEEYFQFVQDLQGQLDYSIERVASKLELSPSQLYSLVRYLELRLMNIVGAKSKKKVYILPSVTYSTVCAFLTQHTLVNLTLTERSRLFSMSISPLQVKGVGTFVETSVLNYLRGTKSSDSFEINGSYYVSYNSFLAKFGLQPNEVSSALKSALVGKETGTEEFIPYDFVRHLDKVMNLGSISDARLGALICLGLLEKKDLEGVLSVSEFRQFYNQVFALKVFPLNKASYKYVAEGSKTEVFQKLQLPFYSKELLFSVLKDTLRGLPLDQTYRGYFNVYRMVEFLKVANNTYELPIFITNIDGVPSVAMNKKSWNSLISVSSNILLAPSDGVSEDLLSAYNTWEILEFEKVREGVEKILNG